MVFEKIVDPIFAPLLKLPELWAIIIISIIMTVLITMVYKWMTDQHLMKTLKEDMKKFRDQMKQFKEDPKKVMEIQKRAMETNMKYMMHSMKPTLITFIPIIIMFGWLNGHLAYLPITPDSEFTTTAMFEKGTEGQIELVAPEEIEIISEPEQEIKEKEARWKLKGPGGNYLLEYNFKDSTYTKDLLITEKQQYVEPEKKIGEDGLKTIKIDNEKLKPLNLFGWRLGWLGTYIIFSIVFSISLRKILKIH